MSENVVRLASSQSKPVRVCGTCGFLRKHNGSSLLNKCDALGSYADITWNSVGYCNRGEWWKAIEPKPPGFWKRLGLLILAKLGAH